MKHQIFAASTAIALIFGGQSAQALTAEDVWDAWKSTTTGIGGTITAESETRNGASLEITGIVSTSRNALSGDEFTMSIKRLTLAENADGSVAMDTGEGFTFQLVEDAGEAEKPTFVVAVSQPGSSIIASGEAGAITYDFTIPVMQARLLEAYDPVKKIDRDLQLEVNFSDMSGKYHLSPQGDGKSVYRADLSTGKIALTSKGTDAEKNTTFDVRLDLAGMKSASSGNFLSEELMQNLGQAIEAGFGVNSQTDFTGLDLAVDILEQGETSHVKAKLDSAAFNAVIDDTTLGYGFSLLAGDIGAEIPRSGIPGWESSFTEATMQVSLPSKVSEVAGDFSLLTRLVDVKLSDSLWGLADPGAQFPRDPATLILDVAAKGAWLVNVFDQGTTTPDGKEPIRFDSISLREAALKLVGAGATAAGDLTFDNSDLVTFRGMPAPTGKINVNLSGVSTLIDKLAAIGLISANDVSGVRFGLAFFARPGAGPDELTSEIEFRDKGLWVNGQQVM